MPVIILLIVIVVLLLGGAGLIFSLIYAAFVLLWALLPWIAGVAVLMFIVALLKPMLAGRDTVRRHERSDPLPNAERANQEPKPHVPSESAIRAMAEQKRLKDEYLAKIEAAKKARGE